MKFPHVKLGRTKVIFLSSSEAILKWGLFSRHDRLQKTELKHI